MGILPTFALGSFQARRRISLQKAETTETRQGDFTANALLNWRDLASEPDVPGDIYATALPTRLIANSQFRQTDYSYARFGEKDEVRLPWICVLLLNPCSKKGKAMSLTIDLAPIAYEQSETEWLPNRKPYLYQQQVYQLVCETLERKEDSMLIPGHAYWEWKNARQLCSLDSRHGEPVLGVYPTNELIADQERALRAEFEASGTNRVLRVDSNELDRWQINYDLKRHSETLETLLQLEPVLLTNPDILFYLFFGLYQGQPGIAQRLFTLVGDVYSTFVFDEFHLYNIKQVADVAFLIGALQRINPARGRVFIFASATPSSPIVPLLREKFGLRVETIEGKPSESPQAKTNRSPIATHPAFQPTLTAGRERLLLQRVSRS